MRRRVKLIFNPHADRGRAWSVASSLQAILERHGGGDWASTEHPGHATQLAEQAARDGYDTVAAVGGDGTVHEIVNGLMRVPQDRRPPLSIVPIGSGNDFANNVGISMDSETAMQRVYSGEPKEFDLGSITDSGGRTEFWDNTLGIGFDATVTIHSYQITRLQGFSMYLWAVIQTILRNHEAPHMSVTTDAEAFEEDLLMLTLCNGPREGGGFLVAPDAKPDDGILQYAAIRRVSRPMMFRLIPEVMKGTHGRFKAVRLGQFRNLKLQADRPVRIHTDGEIFAGFTSQVDRLEVRIHPHELRVIV